MTKFVAVNVKAPIKLCKNYNRLYTKAYKIKKNVAYLDGSRVVASLQASASLQLCTHPLTYLQ